MSKNLVKLLPLVAALAVSSLANASTSAEVPSIVVKYGDLNLKSSAGVKTLHARLRTAAKQVCSPLDGRVLGERGQFEGCVTGAVSRAVADVGNPNLTRLHLYGRVGQFVAAS